MRNTRNIKKALFAGIAGFAIAAAPGTAEKVFAETTCPLNREKFADLENIQNNFEIDSLLRVREEVQIRRAILHEVVDCAMAELIALRTNFENTAVADENAKTLAAQFSPWFQSTLNYYILQKSQISDLGLQGSKDFAKNFSAWRNGNYAPVAKAVPQFIIWSRNQELMKTAQNRLNQMKRAVEIFRLGLNEEIRIGISATELELQKALASNVRAREILRAQNGAEEAAEATRNSLESLAKSYEKMLSLAEKINKAIVR